MKKPTDIFIIRRDHHIRMDTPATSPLSDVLQTLIEQIRAGLPKGATLEGPVQLVLSTIIRKDKRGEVEIRVVEEGAKIPESQIQRITVPVTISPVEEGEPAKEIPSKKYAQIPVHHRISSFDRKRNSLLYGSNSRRA